MKLSPELKKLGDFTTTLHVLPIAGLAVVIGLIAAFVALGLLRLIGLFTNLFYYQSFGSNLVSPAGNHLGWWAVLVPVAGGLIIGLMARYGSERIRGHGIPEAIESILINGSKVQPKLAILKPLSAAISIGTGGPFGAEGPIIMTGGAFGSMIAQFFHLTSAERKDPAGGRRGGGHVGHVRRAARGGPARGRVAAVRMEAAQSDSGGVGERNRGRGAAIPHRPRSALPDAGAPGIHWSRRAARLRHLRACWPERCRHCSPVPSTQPRTHSQKLPIHWMWWPAIGGLVIGLGGMIFPQALGVGYDTIGALLQGNGAIGHPAWHPAGEVHHLGGIAGIRNIRRSACAAADDGRRVGRS